jgi:hypothetical protein
LKNLVVAFMLVAGSCFAHAGNLCQQAADPTEPNDWRPWPWGQEIQIPWRGLQGVWETSGGECENLFLFKVKSNQNGEKLVQIVQYDPQSCRIVAQGLGYESGRYVNAQMVRQGQTYNLTIHAFNGTVMTESQNNDQQSPNMSVMNSSDITKGSRLSGRFVLALTLSPVGKWDDKSAFEISKVSNVTSMICRDHSVNSGK